jgi:hypothetical protein
MVVTNLDADVLLHGIEALGIINPVEKLDRLIRETYKIISKAVQDKKVHPYSNRIIGIKATFGNLEGSILQFDKEALLKKLENPAYVLDKKISICDDYNKDVFTFHIHEHETSEMLRKIREYTYCLERGHKELSRIEQEALNEIKLYDLASQDVLKREEILKRASIIVPENNADGRVYNILEINLNGGVGIVNERRVYSPDDINENIDQLLLQIIAIARNSEKYPYEETAKPVVISQYESLCMIQH